MSDQWGERLPRTLGLFNATAVVVGVIIGAGIFRVPASVAAQLHEPSLVAQERRRVELAEIGRLRLRIAADRDVVVAEHRERRLREDAHQPPQHLLAARVREQVAGDRDEIRASLAHPDRGLPRRADPRRRNAEVEVGQVRDAEPVQLRGQARHLDLELAQPRPRRLGETPRETGAGEGAERSQTSRRSRAGRGSTM